MIENFLGSQLARKEHNASFDFDKLWADRCPPISSTTLLTSGKNVVYQRYHAANVGMFSESAKRIKDFLWLATKMPLRLWRRGRYQKKQESKRTLLSVCLSNVVYFINCLRGLMFNNYVSILCDSHSSQLVSVR